MAHQSDEYAEIGQKIINAAFPELKDVRIAFVASEKEKKTKDRIIFADCSKVSERYAWCCPYDFVITIYDPNAQDMSEDQLKILIEHELRHCGVDENGGMYVKSHDIEEFRTIIDRFGLDWARTPDVDYALLD